MDEVAAQAREVRPSEVIAARRWFLQAFFYQGSGWFKDVETAENMFDSLVEDEAFTSEYLIQGAANMRRDERADDPSAQPNHQPPVSTVEEEQ